MAATVLQAAVERFDASNIGAPLWNTVAPEGASPPYVVVRQTAKTTSRQSEGVYLETIRLAFECVAAGPDAADELERKVEDAFDGWEPDVSGINVMDVVRLDSSVWQDTERMPSGQMPGRAPVEYQVMVSRVRPTPGG